MASIEPIVLTGRYVELVPFSRDHRDALAEAVRDGELWRLWYTAIPSPEEMAAEIERRLGLQAAGSMLPLAVLDGPGGCPISIKPAEGENWYGYATTNDAQELLVLYGALVGALLDSTGIAGFCYTQLTDTEQETNGLLTAARKPKLDISAIRAITSRPAGSVPSEILDAIYQHEVAARRRSRTEE